MQRWWNRLLIVFVSTVISIGRKLEKRSFDVDENIVSRWYYSRRTRIESCHLDSRIRGVYFRPMAAGKFKVESLAIDDKIMMPHSRACTSTAYLSSVLPLLLLQRSPNIHSRVHRSARDQVYRTQSFTHMHPMFSCQSLRAKRCRPRWIDCTNKKSHKLLFGWMIVF